MNLVKLALKRETSTPILALVLASCVSVGLILGRIFSSGRGAYLGLIWNLFLAWLPLVFALLALDRYERASQRDWRFGVFTGAWLLFFPNSPYIFTDIFHLVTHSYFHFWIDLVLVLCCAFTGLVLGFLSLYLMQGIVARLYGAVMGWLFIAATAILGSFGIYLGRFLRFNSWDVVTRPRHLYHGIGQWAADPFAHSTTFAFPVLFALFLFVSYLTLYTLTHLRPVAAPSPVNKDRELGDTNLDETKEPITS